jgi:hypothetical protein
MDQLANSGRPKNGAALALHWGPANRPRHAELTTYSTAWSMDAWKLISSLVQRPSITLFNVVQLKRKLLRAPLIYSIEKL